MGFNNNNINASADMITIPSLNGTLSWADNSVPIGYSSDAITGSLYSGGINLSEALDGIKSVLATQEFQKIMANHQDYFSHLNDDQISTLMRNFAFEYWQHQPKFSKRHVLIDIEKLQCRIFDNMQDALEMMLQGYQHCCDIFY